MAAILVDKTKQNIQIPLDSISISQQVSSVVELQPLLSPIKPVNNVIQLHSNKFQEQEISFFNPVFISEQIDFTTESKLSIIPVEPVDSIVELHSNKFYEQELFSFSNPIFVSKQVSPEIESQFSFSPIEPTNSVIELLDGVFHQKDSFSIMLVKDRKTESLVTDHIHDLIDIFGLQGLLDLKANLDSPVLTGIPIAPTASLGTNTNQIATTAFVIANTSVGSFDLNLAISGATTKAIPDDPDQFVFRDFMGNALRKLSWENIMNHIRDTFTLTTITHFVESIHMASPDNVVAGGAGTIPYTAIPRFGIDTRTTFPSATHTHPVTQITVSTTNRILGRVAAGGGPIEEIIISPFVLTLFDDADAATVRTTIGAASATHVHAITDITDLQTALNLKANLVSPIFTGIPEAPTAPLGNNTTQLATTAFVMANAADFQIPQYRTGVFYPNSVGHFVPTIGTREITAGQAIGSAFVVSGGGVQMIDQWGINVTVAATTGTFEARISVYSSVNGQTGTLLLNTLVTGLNTTGWKPVAANFTFEIGRLYYMVVHFGCNPTVSALTGGIMHMGFTDSAANTFTNSFLRVITWGTALPTTWTWAEDERSTANPILVRLRQAATTLPATPNALVVTNDGWGGINSSWNAVAGALTYIVETRVNGANVTSREVFGVTWNSGHRVYAVGQTVEVRVAARNAIGQSAFSAWSTGVVIAHAVPQNIVLVNMGAGRVDSSWDALVGTNIYLIERRIAGVLQVVVETGANNHTQGGLTHMSLYEIRVAARNVLGNTNPYSTWHGILVDEPI